MMNMLASLESSDFSTWLRTSSSIWAYPTVLTLHTLGLAVLVGSNWAIDLRLLGVADAIPLRALHRLFRLMWIGFWLNTVSGALLFAADATTKGTTKLFLFKLALVAVGVGLIVLTKRLVYGGEVEMPSRAPVRLLAAGSILVWIAAIAAGRMMAYI
jgi:hypothetical protein